MCRFSSYRKLRKFSFILVVLKPRNIFELIQRRYPLSASMVNVSMLLALLLGVAKDGPIEANSEWVDISEPIPFVDPGPSHP